MKTLLDRVRRKIGFNPVVWAMSVPRMRRFAQEFATPAPAGPHALVVISPWLGSAVPWFSLGVGLMLAAEGAKVTFAVDDHRFGPNRLRHRVIVAAIRRVMTVVARRHDVIHLSKLALQANDVAPKDEIARLAKLNTIWAMRGEMVEEGRQAFEKICSKQIAGSHGRIAAVFRGRTFDVLFTPGGVYGASGIWAYNARLNGVRISSFDSGGYETVMLAAEGLACQLQDVPRAFRTLRWRSEITPGERVAAIAAANKEIEKRKMGSDAFESQVKNSGAGSEALRGGVLIALNSSWDAAALGPHHVFAGNTDWIVETIRHLLDHTTAPVIVRQHPVERLAFARTTDDYAALLKHHFGENPRLHFIAAEDPINTYALLEQVVAVVVHCSTIGIEAVAFGKPVVTGSTAYYSDLGFVRRADDLEQYRALLVDAAAGRLTVTEAMREDAHLCFYITQCCNWVFSAFNPADYAKWSRQSLSYWREQPAVQRMLRSLLTNTPVAELNHVARWEEEVGPA